MASHANILSPSIDDYYRIVDPKGTLSQPERIRKMNDVLDNLPRSFPKALCSVMELAGMTIEELEWASKVSSRTISRYRTGETKSYSEDKIVAMCVAMRLPPWLSRELVKAAGLGLSETPHQRLCMMILDCMYTASVDEVQAILNCFGEDALKLTA
jgi:transcriptional regulator with XRE-family HTH domain